MNYTIGDFVIRLKNAALARKKELYVPFSKIQKEIGKVLVKEGFLEDIKEDEIEGKKTLYVKLRYQRRRPSITDITVISKPSLRIYIGSDEIAKKQGKARTIILSSNNGIITGKEAMKKKIGGELLFKIW